MFQLIIILIAAVIAGNISARLCIKRWGGSLIKVSVLSAILALVVTTISFLAHGFGESIRTVFIFSLCFYASYGDIKTHEADDWIHFLLLITALIGKPLVHIPMSLIAVLVTAGIMTLITMFVPGSGIGGADIKFTAAAAFLTSLEGSLIGLLLGTFAALICNSPFSKKKGEKQGFPMLPYLSCSYMLVYLLS